MSSALPKLQEKSKTDVAHHAALALEAGNMGTFEWDLIDDRAFCDETLVALCELPGADVDGKFLFNNVHPDDVDLLQFEIGRVLDRDEDYDTAFRIICQNGEVRWIGARGRVVERRNDGTPVRMLGLNWDMTQVKDHENQLRMMMREMNHRVNNAFALIESMLELGRFESASLDSFADMLCAQVHALADAHQLAADFFLHQSDNTGSVSVEKVLKKVMRVWREGPFANRVNVQCDAGLAMPLKDITPFSMILYELATNAAKYSVLGGSPGVLTVSLKRQEPGVARFDWIERTDKKIDIKASKPADKGGFGTVLMQHCIQKMRARSIEHDLGQYGLKLSLELTVIDE